MLFRTISVAQLLKLKIHGSLRRLTAQANRHLDGRSLEVNSSTADEARRFITAVTEASNWTVSQVISIKPIFAEHIF
jgi:hypothetical protein